MSDVTVFGKEPISKPRPEEYPPRGMGVSPTTRAHSVPRQT
jgi:hypothetical protein